MGKTETIKKRAVYVYLPSIEMIEDWKKRAEKTGSSISKFVIERVEDSIRREDGDESYVSRLELVKRLGSVEAELGELRDENRLLKKLVDNLDKELKGYRVKPFLEEEFTGVRMLDQDLINILKKGGTISDEDILANLSIDREDVNLIKAVNRQLEVLETYGLVEFTGKGWRWRS